MSARTPQLVLASSSAYRAKLLSRLGIKFITRNPPVQETIRADETAPGRAVRLAVEKAAAVATEFSNAVVIGSDQVATCGDKILEKPGNADRAVSQLILASGRKVDFHTAVSVRNTASGWEDSELVNCSVYFRELTNAEINSYIKREQPYDCAGSIKTEGLGIALIERMEGSDATALVGLPLIALFRMLRQAGVEVLP